MFNDTTELAENKLLVLYILDKISMPLSNSLITQIILENNLINYFSLQQYLSELVESGLINDTREEKRHLFTLTTRGRNALNLFNSRIPDNKKEVIDGYISTHMNNIKKDIEVIGEYEPLGKNKYIVNLKLRDGDHILIDIKLPADSNLQARNLCQNWKDNFQELYKKILEMFSL